MQHSEQAKKAAPRRAGSRQAKVFQTACDVCIGFKGPYLFGKARQAAGEGKGRGRGGRGRALHKQREREGEMLHFARNEERAPHTHCSSDILSVDTYVVKSDIWWSQIGSCAYV